MTELLEGITNGIHGVAVKFTTLELLGTFSFISGGVILLFTL